MKNIFFLLIIVCSSCTVAQSKKEVKKALRSIEQLEQVTTLQQQHPNWEMHIIATNISEDAHFLSIKKPKLGTVFKKKEQGNNYLCKVIETEQVQEFRASHIYINGKDYSLTEIDSLRTIILEKYENGVPFADLAKQYSSYSTPNDGDLGWFKEGIMVAVFEEAIKNREKDEVFTVDIPERNWYYVVLKTHTNRESTLVNSLEIKYQ